MITQFESYSDQNKSQVSAIDDTFSINRYKQFAKHLSIQAHRVMDIGCAEGRGGEALKVLRPNIELIGLDCVKERLDLLPKCYD
jgi:hypothetical protein